MIRLFFRRSSTSIFVPHARLATNSITEERETPFEFDDNGTNDSGSVVAEIYQGTEVSSFVYGREDNCSDNDQGIDVNLKIINNEGKGYIHSESID